MGIRRLTLGMMNLSVGLILVLVVGGEADDEADDEAMVPAYPATAEEVVKSFYRWYVAYDGDPIADRAYRSMMGLTEDLVGRVDRLSAAADTSEMDPFLCSRSRPESISVGSAVLSGDTASVIVRTGADSTAFSVELRRAEGRWLLHRIVCGGQGESGDRPQAAAHQRIDVPDAGMAFEIPAGWIWQEPAWVWTPDDTSRAHLGFNWADIRPPMEPEVMIMSGQARVLDSEPVELDWGSARRFTLEVYGVAAEGTDAQAPVRSVEIHILVVVTGPGGRRGFDFYASADTPERLSGLEPALWHMLRSARLHGTPRDEAAPESD